MRRILAGLIISLFATAPVLAQGVQAVPGEYIVKYKSTSTSVNVSKVRSKLASKANLRKAFPAMGMYHISLKAQAGEAANLEEIKNDPDVEYVEPNLIWNKTQDNSSSNNAQSSAYQGVYSYNDIINNHYAYPDNNYWQSSAPTAVPTSWSNESDVTTKGTVVVAVVDTGLDPTHRLFQTVANGGAGALWQNTAEVNGLTGVDDDQNGFIDDKSGWNFYANTSNWADDDNHGTHVAGIIVGTGQNIFATTLSQSKVLIMPLKFLGADGSGTTTSAINAIYYAVQNGAQIINNSWGGSTYSKALHEALAYAYDHQVLIVSAAGNYGDNNDTTDMYPANYDVPSNIAVASATNSNMLSGFSNYGANLVHIASPGEYILSSLPSNQYGYMSGTSMAAPFVSGIAAMALREDSAMTGYQVKQLLMSNVDVYPALNGYVSSSGRINAATSIIAAKNSVGTLATYQPVYKAQYQADRSPASGSAGCGLVSSAMSGGPGAGGPNPMAGVISGLLLLPLIVWFALRRRDPASRRKFERFRMNSQIRVMIGDRELVGSMNTISQGGLSFNTDQALEKGGIITMRIQSPDGHEMIEVQGQVVWSEANQAYGVQFANARQGTLAMIQQWTQALVKS